MKLRRRGLALALARDPRDHRVPANEEDLADFETDLAAPVQICRIADALSPGHWRPSRIYAQLMPTSTRGRIPDAHSLGQLAQAAAETARSHLDAAEVLLVHGSWPQARALRSVRDFARKEWPPSGAVRLT